MSTSASALTPDASAPAPPGRTSAGAPFGGSSHSDTPATGRCALSPIDPSFAEALQDRYAIERELGRGGAAVVYLARDRRHGRPVAVKVLHGEVGGAVRPDRFLREIELAAGLTHPHILPVHDSGDAGGVLYYVMPYVAGESLRARLERERRLPPAEAVRLAGQVADALDYAHRRGIVHRDIKPENILLEEGHAVVSDFGIARVLGGDGAGDAFNRTGGGMIGTPHYMSPEQADGDPDLDGRADIYSLGCVLFETLTGRPPFTGRTAQGIMVRRLLEPAPALRSLEPSIPERVAAAVARALARYPDERFATAAEFGAALEAGDSPEETGPPPVRRPAGASVAVLPFVNLSSDPENEYLSDGITEELIGALAKVPGLRVASRTSSFGFKGTEQDARAIGERLGVRAIVEGSVRKAGNRLRIAAQLVDTADGYHRWSETYDRELADVFAVQDELAQTLASSLTPRLSSQESPLIEPGTASVEAYSLVLRGTHFAWKRSARTYRIALDYFEQAVRADPKYARAHAMVAFAYTMLGFDEFAEMPPREAMPRAKAAIRRALDLDPALGQAHCRQAIITFLFDWDWELAERELEHARRLDPDDLATLHWHSMFLSAMGRHEESLAAVAHALRLDPLSEPMRARLGHAYYFAGRYDDALRELLAAVEMEPGSVMNVVLLARAYLRLERPGEARSLLADTIGRVGRVPLLVAYLGQAHGDAGERSEAQALLAELDTLSRGRYISPLYLAIVHLGLGNHDEALRLWERAYEERCGWLAYLRSEPSWDRLRGNSRFTDLIRRMRFDT